MNDKKIYKFFPFVSSRLGSLLKYINRMYENDYQIVDIIFDCVLVFEKSPKKDGYTYFILTEECNRGRRKRWDDIEFLEERSEKFHKGNGEKLDKFNAVLAMNYYVYLTKHISTEEYNEVCEYRKKHLIRANILRVIISIIMIAGLSLTIYRYLK